MGMTAQNNAAMMITTPQRIEFAIKSHPKHVADARHAIEAFAAARGFGQCAVDEIGLVLNEALANVIRHAYHGDTGRAITVGAEWDGQQIRLSVRDWGSGINPQELAPRKKDPLQPGGLGLVCLRSMMDEVVFTRQPDGMLLTMTRRRGGETAADCGCGSRGPRKESA
jgi:anti-sigma regulatory factor (Ser/Thr protein kinase)